MLRILLVVILSALILAILSNCASGQLPPPPKGRTCIGDVSSGGFDCSPIPQDLKPLEEMLDTPPESLVVNLKLNAKSTGDFVPFSGVDNWVAFDPDTWASIQSYIGSLKVIAQKQCQF